MHPLDSFMYGVQTSFNNADGSGMPEIKTIKTSNTDVLVAMRQYPTRKNPDGSIGSTEFVSSKTGQVQFYANKLIKPATVLYVLNSAPNFVEKTPLNRFLYGGSYTTRQNPNGSTGASILSRGGGAGSTGLGARFLIQGDFSYKSMPSDFNPSIPKNDGILKLFPVGYDQNYDKKFRDCLAELERELTYVRNVDIEKFKADFMAKCLLKK